MPLIGNSKYASSKDNFAPLSPKGKITKMQLDFSRVKESIVNPRDLRMTVIKGTKFTTVARVKNGEKAEKTGKIKVKVNKKTNIATISCKGDGNVTLPMEDGYTYTISFTVNKPKGQKHTLSVGSGSVIKTMKDLFNTDIDSGDLNTRSKKNAAKVTVSADNLVVIDPKGKDTIKLKYKYMNKKYKMNIKVR